MQISPTRIRDPFESNFRSLAVSDSQEVATPLIAEGSAVDLLEGRSEAGGSVLEACASPECIAVPGVNEGTTAALGLVEGCPSTTGTNAMVGKVAPSHPMPVLVVVTLILERSPSPMRLSESC